MTLARDMKRIATQFTRRWANTKAKVAKAAQRKAEAIALGKTVIVTEVDGVKTYSFPKPPRVPPTPPRLSWLSGKMAHQHNPQKGRSGHKPEHTAALLEDPSQTLAKEIEKAQREVQKENLEAILPPTAPAPEVAEITA